MKVFLKIIFVLSIVVICISSEDYIMQGSGILIGIGLVLLGMAIGDRTELRESLHDFAVKVGAIIAFLFFFFASALEVHMEEQDKGKVIIKSRFYTHILTCADKIEHKRLRTYYTKDIYGYDVQAQHYLFLFHGQCCSVYNTFGNKIMDIPDTFSIESRDYGHGLIDHLKFNGKCYDLEDGREVTEDYHPDMIIITEDNFSNL